MKKLFKSVMADYFTKPEATVARVTLTNAVG